MSVPNPIYIDQNAIHRASQLRALVYAATEGREGVFSPLDLAIKAQTIPDATVQMQPGAYVMKAKHTGGQFESYIGKVAIAEDSLSISPVGAGGPRTDLVILRIENPYVVGSGVWSAPPDEAEGPYAYLRVIENVTPNINHVVAWNSTWTAIPLARITRPANTGIVQQAHLVELRSIAKIGEERLIIIENPPYDPPPIAQAQFVESTALTTSDEFTSVNTTTWTNWPTGASWDVPVPEWAIGFDIHCYLNPQCQDNMYGDMRAVINNGGISNDDSGILPSKYDHNMGWIAAIGTRGPLRETMMIGGTGILNPAHRGKVVNFRLQAKNLANEGGKMNAIDTRVNLTITFKRYPVISDGA